MKLNLRRLRLLALGAGTALGLSLAAAPVTANVYGDYLASRHAETIHDYRNAAGLMERVLEAVPDSERLRREAFLSLINAGYYQRAAAVAKDMRDKGDSLLPVAELALGIDAMAAGDYEAARNIFALIKPVRLERFTAALAQAWANMGAGKTDKALEALEALDDNNGFTALRGLHKALILEAAGRRDEARSLLLGKAETAQQTPVQMFRALIRLDLAEGKTEEARNQLQRYMTDNPGHVVLEKDLETLMKDGALPPLMPSPMDGLADGFYHMASGIQGQSSELAFFYARLANWLSPQADQTLILLAGMMEDRDRYEDANAIYDTMQDASPFKWAVRLQMADNLFNLERREEAMASLQAMVSERPGRTEPLVRLGNILRYEERYEEAAETYEKAIGRLNPPRPTDWFLYYYAGMSHERAKNWDDAEPRFLKALELRPDDPNVLNYLGYSWVEMGRNLEQAQEMIKRAVKRSRHNGYIVDSLGWVYYKVGKFAEAVTELERAVQLMPQDPVINDHLGDAYWQMGRKREARFQWGRASRLDPDEDLAPKIQEKLENGLKADSNSN